MKEKSQSINLWQLKDIFVVIFVLLGVMLLYLGTAQLFGFDTAGIYYLIVSQIVFYLTIIFTVFYQVFINKKNNFRDFFGTENFSKNIFWGVVGFVLLVFTATLIDLISEKFIGIGSRDIYKGIDKNFLLSISIVGVFFAPLAEEVFFRGFLQTYFVKKLGKIVGIAFICLIFAVSHVIYLQNMAAFLEITFVGIILSSLKESTNSLIPCIIAHFLNNLSAVILMLFI